MSVQNLSNADAVFEAVDEQEREQANAAISKSEALATKKRLEAKAEVDRENQIVMMPIDGEAVPMYPLEAGKVLEVSRKLIEGLKNDDVVKQLEAEDDKRQLMAEKNYHPDVFDREFFNSFEKEEIKDAWDEWGNRSRNTDEPLGNR